MLLLAQRVVLELLGRTKSGAVDTALQTVGGTTPHTFVPCPPLGPPPFFRAGGGGGGGVGVEASIAAIAAPAVPHAARNPVLQHGSRSSSSHNIALPQQSSSSSGYDPTAGTTPAVTASLLDYLPSGGDDADDDDDDDDDNDDGTAVGEVRTPAVGRAVGTEFDNAIAMLGATHDRTVTVAEIDELAELTKGVHVMGPGSERVRSTSEKARRKLSRKRGGQKVQRARVVGELATRGFKIDKA